MKITQPHFSPLQATPAAGASKEISESSPTSVLRAEKSAAIDPVVGEAQMQLQGMEEIDMARVAEMKLAISKGEIAVNIDELTLSVQHYFQR
ncbi:flagellar biosynthesis protein FlgM [uncultured Leclercia sp.]|uniref:flagellar biosynthesis protein FlgM n=1 Tax=uncultured Leclercia sp. TaxID=332959 RepID=UPI002591E3E2|nr:flagellar biosynthesis protein FlgM [uncultured Leclercia sp.]